MDGVFGFLIFPDKNIIYINKNNIQIGHNVNPANIITKKASKEEKDYFMNIVKKRLEDIYNISKKRKKTAGNVNIDNVNFINCHKKYNTFTKAFHKLYFDDRSFTYPTESIDDINAVFLCYFHIDCFDVSNLKNEIKYKDIKNETYTLNIKNLNANKKAYIKNDQDVLDDLSNTINEIVSGKPIHPIYLDASYDIDGHRNISLSDGNHRITSLKLLGYNGLVPCILCDYAPIELY